MTREPTTKRIISAGKGSAPEFPKGSKATFHFKSIKRDDTGKEVIIDDSWQLDKPLELLMGKQFKMPVLEDFIRTMRVGEVSRFSAIKPLIINYPFVSQAYRKYARPHDSSDDHNHASTGHCCASTLTKGLGYPDLDDLMQKTPEYLEFEIELLSAEEADEYEKEIWQMDDEEKMEEIPKLRLEGNSLFKSGGNQAAVSKYSKALEIIEQLILKEKHGDEEWTRLDNMKIPLLLNLAQCKYQLNEFYECITFATEVIKRDSKCLKAVFRRAKANAAAWNFKEARDDFITALDLDPSLESTVKKELLQIQMVQKEKEKEDQIRFSGKLFT